MSTFNDTIINFNTTATNSFSFLDNEVVSFTVILLLILYAVFAVSYLPPSILQLFDYPLFNFVVLFIIAYASRKNPTVGIIAGIAFLVTIQTLNKLKAVSTVMPMTYPTEPMVDIGMLPQNQQSNEMVLEDITSPEVMIPEGAVTQIQVEEKSQPGCTVRANFRNSFYPQYVNMKPDAYMARYNGLDVDAYDPDADYAKLDKY